MKFVLAGNPNSGKTTLFNTLTGSTAYVGNWPGVTVDKREGTYKKLPEKVTIIDLPGIYSLSPYSPEEIVSRNCIIDDKPDAIINIVDATNLERNLYLTTQLLETDRPMVIALNMSDALEKSGDKIDITELEKLLGVPVVSISALKKKGIKELMSKAYEAAKGKREPFSVLLASDIGGMFFTVLEMLKSTGIDNPMFHAIKLIEGDSLEISSHPEAAKIVADMKKNFPENDFDNDFEGIVADARYKYITANYAKALKKAKDAGAMTRSDKIDRVLTHRIFGIPVFLLIMFAVFHIIFSGNFLYLSVFGIGPVESPGVFLQTQLGNLTGLVIEAAENGLSGAKPWVSSLIVDGLLSGIDAVLSFLPQMLLLFLFLSILEDSGYMARVAFIMDRAFRKFGLSGRAFMPLLMCFGCAVPGIMATKALNNEKERRIAITIAPFFSCGAKLPIWATFAATIFLNRGGEFIVFFMYLLGIVTAIILAVIMHFFSKDKEVPPFLMELPAYHLPQLRNTLTHLWQKVKHYLSKVITVIAGAVVIIWVLTTFNFSFRMVEDSADSIIGIVSRNIQWLFWPLGFGRGAEGWKFIVATFTGLIAKEMVVATLGVFSGMDNALDGGELAGTGIAVLIGTLSIPAAIAFMAFNLLSVPCMAAVGAAGGEFKSKKQLLKTIGIWLLTAFTVSAIIYWVGTYWWIGLILVALIGIGIACAVIIDKKRKKVKISKN